MDNVVIASSDANLISVSQCAAVQVNDLKHLRLTHLIFSFACSCLNSDVWSTNSAKSQVEIGFPGNGSYANGIPVFELSDPAGMRALC